MDIRRLVESLQGTLPLLLRHFGSYIDLVEQDWSAVKATFINRSRLALLCSAAATFGLLLLCIFFIAITWDGEYRVLTIGLMAAAFAVIALASGIALNRKDAKAFKSVRREWREDRVLIERALFNEEHQVLQPHLKGLTCKTRMREV